MEKDKLEYIKSQVSIILQEIYENKDKLKLTRKSLEEGIIINGKYLGKDKIEEDIYKLDVLAENLINVIEHCNQKIESIENNNSTISFNRGN